MHGHWLKGYLREGKEIETGGGGSGGGGALLVNITPVSDTEARADKTWGEIQTAFDSGRPVFMNMANGRYPVFFCANQNGAYGLRYFSYTASSIAAANVLVVNEGVTAGDYPVITSGGGGNG